MVIVLVFIIFGEEFLIVFLVIIVLCKKLFFIWGDFFGKLMDLFFFGEVKILYGKGFIIFFWWVRFLDWMKIEKIKKKLSLIKKY